jgi:single-strand DNA-binding protein
MSFMNLNKAMIIGNLTRDPEVRNTPSGATVTSFAVATNLIWTDQQGQRQEKVEFHNVIAWRKLGEICGQYLHKGSKVYIEGRLQTRDWVGQDGVKRYRTEIIAENMIMLDRAGAGSGSVATLSEEVPAPGEEAVIDAGEPVDGESGPDEEDIKVENIPF